MGVLDLNCVGCAEEEGGALGFELDGFDVGVVDFRVDVVLMDEDFEVGEVLLLGSILSFDGVVNVEVFVDDDIFELDVLLEEVRAFDEDDEILGLVIFGGAGAVTVFVIISGAEHAAAAVSNEGLLGTLLELGTLRVLEVLVGLAAPDEVLPGPGFLIVPVALIWPGALTVLMGLLNCVDLALIEALTVRDVVLALVVRSFFVVVETVALLGFLVDVEITIEVAFFVGECRFQENVHSHCL